MNHEKRVAEARRILEQTIRDIEWYQVYENLDFDTSEDDATEILKLIHGATVSFK